LAKASGSQLDGPSADEVGERGEWRKAEWCGRWTGAGEFVANPCDGVQHELRRFVRKVEKIVRRVEKIVREVESRSEMRAVYQTDTCHETVGRNM
jgi:hypothetical protein